MRSTVTTVLLLGFLAACSGPQPTTPAGFMAELGSFVERAKNGYLERSEEAWMTLDAELDIFMKIKYSEVEDQLRPEQRVRVERLTSEYEVYRTAAQILQPLRDFNELDHAAMVAEVDAFVGSLEEVSTDGMREINTALPKLKEDLRALKGSFEPLTLKLDSLVRAAHGNVHQ